MSAPADGARPEEDPAVYFEPARSYLSTLVLLAGLCAGLIIDVALGGALVHLVAWLVAIVVVVGFSLFTTRTARRLRSVTVTAHDVRVGAATLARVDIVSIDTDVDPTHPVLGRAVHEGPPRGVAGLTVRLSDGAVVVIPTRHPHRLAAALHLEPATEGVPDIRPAERADLTELEDIDRRAETLFRVSGIDLPAVPFPIDELNEAKAIFVAGRPAVGFVRVDEVDRLAHIEALAVIPGAMRRGVGTALLEAACTWARAAGYPAITLITFADVPWNAPFYAARGFAETAPTPEIAELRDWERAVGLDAVGRRIVMRRDLTD